MNTVAKIVKRITRSTILDAVKRKAGPQSTKKGKKGYSRKVKHKGKNDE